MFGKRLRATRLARKYTQPKLAEMLDIALRTYQNYEEGSRRPSFEVLIKIGDTLDISIDYLLVRDDYLRSLGVSADVFPASPQDSPK